MNNNTAFQFDAAVMSCLLCLISVSIFVRVNFLLKALAMIFTAITHLTLYFAHIAGNDVVDDEDEVSADIHG